MRPLRVGVIGFGYTGRLHLRAWNETPGAVAVAVAETKNVPLEQRPEGVSWRADYDDLFALDLDAVSVCLPTALHCEVVRQALAAGKHVLVEKPIATTLEDAETMMWAAEQAGRTLFVGMTHRFYPEVLAAKRLVEEGAIGELVMIRDSILEHFGFLDAPGWYLDRKVAGGGVVLSSGIHMVDRTVWFADEEPISVSGAVQNAYFGRDVEDSGQMSLRFASGLSAQITFGFLAEAHPLVCDLELIGTRGSIIVHTWQGYEVRTAEGVTRHAVYHAEPHVEKVLKGLQGEFAEFRDAIAAAREPRPSAAESARALRTIQAFYEAARTGRTVSLE